MEPHQLPMLIPQPRQVWLCLCTVQCRGRLLTMQFSVNSWQPRHVSVGRARAVQSTKAPDAKAASG